RSLALYPPEPSQTLLPTSCPALHPHQIREGTAGCSPERREDRRRRPMICLLR
uniref:Uncharacterized protein n=1 Tax=Aegilops tauschii subsp. strangulata TaxID=200361 RepID=A0A453CI54_AEGTS